MEQLSLSVVIPTYNRGSVVLQTIELLLSQVSLADEILIVDQTQYASDDSVASQLKALHTNKDIRWLQLLQPSIPHAMNFGLQKANSDYVLFLDDDVTFANNFIEQHKLALHGANYLAHVGQILQPWQSPVQLGDYDSGNGFVRDLDFPFNSDKIVEIQNCMAGNLCVHRQSAIDAGGFDEQFEGVAYRFETEFCRRMVSFTKKPFRFMPLATLNHLKIPSGGTRNHAQSHLTSLSGAHSVGDYYFALKQIKRNGVVTPVLYIFKRLLSSVVAKFYLKKPWWMPVRVLAELMGLFGAIRKFASGSHYINLNNKNA